MKLNVTVDEILQCESLRQFFLSHLKEKDKLVFGEFMISYFHYLSNYGNFIALEEQSKDIFKTFSLHQLDEPETTEIYTKLLAHGENIQDINFETVSLSRFDTLASKILRIVRKEFFSFQESKHYDEMISFIQNKRKISLEEIISSDYLHKQRFVILKAFVRDTMTKDIGNLLFLEELISSYYPKLRDYHFFNKHSPSAQRLKNSDQNLSSPKPSSDSTSSISTSFNFPSSSKTKKKLTSLEKTFQYLENLLENGNYLLNEFLSESSRHKATVLSDGVKSYLFVTFDKIKTKLNISKPKKSFYISNKTKLKIGGIYENIYIQLKNLFLLSEQEINKWLKNIIFNKFNKSQFYAYLILKEDKEYQTIKHQYYKTVLIAKKNYYTRLVDKNHLELIRELELRNTEAEIKIISKCIQSNDIEEEKIKDLSGELQRSCAGETFKTETFINKNNQEEEDISERLNKFLPSFVDILRPNGLDVYRAKIKKESKRNGQSNLNSTDISEYNFETSSSESGSFSNKVETGDINKLKLLEDVVLQEHQKIKESYDLKQVDRSRNYLNYLGSSYFCQIQENLNSQVFECSQFKEGLPIVQYSVSLRRTPDFGFGLKFSLDSLTTGFMIVKGFTVDESQSDVKQSELSHNLRKVKVNDALVGITGLTSEDDEDVSLPEGETGNDFDLSNLAGLDFDRVIDKIKLIEVNETVDFIFLRNWEKFYLPCRKCKQIKCLPRCITFSQVSGVISKVQSSKTESVQNLVEDHLRKFLYNFNVTDLSYVIESLFLRRSIVFLSDHKTTLSSVFYYFEEVMNKFPLRESYSLFSSNYPFINWRKINEFLKVLPKEDLTEQTLIVRNFCIGLDVSNLFRKKMHPIEKFLQRPMLFGDNISKFISTSGSKQTEFLIVCCDSGTIVESRKLVNHILKERLRVQSCFCPLLPRDFKLSLLSQMNKARGHFLRSSVTESESEKTTVFDLVSMTKSAVDNFCENHFFKDIELFYYRLMNEDEEVGEEFDKLRFYKEEFIDHICSRLKQNNVKKENQTVEFFLNVMESKVITDYLKKIV